MRVLTALPFFALFISFPAGARAAYAPDFDRGVDIKLFVEAAIESASTAGGLIPPARALASSDSPVWITIEKADADALDAAALKRAPLAQNQRIAVYEVKTSDLDQVADGMYRTFRRSPGFVAHETYTSALAELAGPAETPSRTYVMDQGPRVRGLLALVKEEPIISVISSLSSFRNRNYRSVTGIDSSRWLQREWAKFAEGRSDISVEAFKHASYPQESVILTIRGAIEPGKVVVLGGHLDCVAGYGDNPAPGADDNASGVAVAQEVIRAIVKSGYRPSKTIKFMAFAAEEAGLRGSGDVAAAFKRDGVAVEGMLNLDMANYKGSAKDIYFVTDNTNAGQNAFVQSLVGAYTDYTWGTTRCGYGCSDHASWTRNGFPSTLPFESTFKEYNPHIHKVTDTLDVTGDRAEHALKFARLAAAYAVEMAK